MTDAPNYRERPAFWEIREGSGTRRNPLQLSLRKGERQTGRVVSLCYLYS
jgi:hypothetical protein